MWIGGGVLTAKVDLKQPHHLFSTKPDAYITHNATQQKTDVYSMQTAEVSPQSFLQGSFLAESRQNSLEGGVFLQKKLG